MVGLYVSVSMRVRTTQLLVKPLMFIPANALLMSVVVDSVELIMDAIMLFMILIVLVMMVVTRPRVVLRHGWRAKA
jgi:hypothetical protein